MAKVKTTCVQMEGAVLAGLSVGGMVWQRLSFATAASDMGTKRDQT